MSCNFGVRLVWGTCGWHGKHGLGRGTCGWCGERGVRRRFTGVQASDRYAGWLMLSPGDGKVSRRAVGSTPCFLLLSGQNRDCATIADRYIHPTVYIYPLSRILCGPGSAGPAARARRRRPDDRNGEISGIPAPPTLPQPAAAATRPEQVPAAQRPQAKCVFGLALANPKAHLACRVAGGVSPGDTGPRRVRRRISAAGHSAV
jgi:hypothetical protein